jgi:hypothetical protein
MRRAVLGPDRARDVLALSDYPMRPLTGTGCVCMTGFFPAQARHFDHSRLKGVLALD